MNNIEREINFNTNEIEENIINFLNFLKNDIYRCDIEKNEYLNSIYESDFVVFENDKTIIKSYLTLINGPFGSGKTEFVKNICNFIIKNKAKNNHQITNWIEKVVVIDVFKYAFSENIKSELLQEIYYHILNTLGILNRKKIKLKKYFNYFAKAFNIIAKSINWSLEIPKFNLENNDVNFNKILEKVNSQIENKLKNKKILLFIDNLERLGPKIWGVIWLLQKILSISNLVILLPTYIEKITPYFSGITIDEIMFKFINLPYYEIIPNYKNILEKYFKSTKNIDLINDILMENSKNNYISNRDLENIFVFSSHNVNNDSNKNNNRIFKKQDYSFKKQKKYDINTFYSIYHFIKILKIQNVNPIGDIFKKNLSDLFKKFEIYVQYKNATNLVIDNIVNEANKKSQPIFSNSGVNINSKNIHDISFLTVYNNFEKIISNLKKNNLYDGYLNSILDLKKYIDDNFYYNDILFLLNFFNFYESSYIYDIHIEKDFFNFIIGCKDDEINYLYNLFDNS